jgi:hypothetical protein
LTYPPLLFIVAHLAMLRLVTRFGSESISMIVMIRRPRYFESDMIAAIGSMYSAL